MPDQKKRGISWTDETWNPVRGCSRVSRGCEHCYAERFAMRGAGPNGPYEGLVQLGTNEKPRWTGKVVFVQDKLNEPRFWKLGRKVFVNSMSDLFHEKLPRSAIVKIFGVMGITGRHTYQILTKRPERMQALMADDVFRNEVATEMGVQGYRAKADRMPWPLPNVWLGVSVEDQASVDLRIPWLVDTKAACRFVSVEPLLESVSLYPWVPSLDWVIVGGESGPDARPFDLVWAEQIRLQCADAHTPFWMKQAGGNVRMEGQIVTLRDSHGKDLSELPEALRVQQFPREEPGQLSLAGQ